MYVCIYVCVSICACMYVCVCMLRWSDFQKFSKTYNTWSATYSLLNDKHFGIGFIIYGILEPSTIFIP